MTVEAVDEIAQGRVWTGAEALEIGLVDEIGTLEEAIEYAAMSIEGVTSVEEVQIAAYPKPKTTLETLLESLTGTESAFAGTPIESVEQAFLGWDASQAGKVYARIPYEIVVR
jgi:protease-4